MIFQLNLFNLLYTPSISYRNYIVDIRLEQIIEVRNDTLLIYFSYQEIDAYMCMPMFGQLFKNLCILLATQLALLHKKDIKDFDFHNNAEI